MIGEVLTFLRRYLDERLKSEFGGAGDDPVGDRIVFPDGERTEAAAFKQGAVTLLLFNLEEERLLRAPDPYARRDLDGRTLKVQPDIRLTLFLLFVARFKQYDAAWRHLSCIVEHLQSVRTLDAGAAPDFPPRVERLAFELITLDLAQLGQIWSALRTTHHPSLLYRANLIALRDRQGAEAPATASVETRVRRIP